MCQLAEVAATIPATRRIAVNSFFISGPPFYTGVEEGGFATRSVQVKRPNYRLYINALPGGFATSSV
jgi:hypothetical protein